MRLFGYVMSMDDGKSLAGVEVFSDLDADRLREIEARCRWRNYDAQEQIIDFQDDSQDVFFITRGAVRVVNYSVSGREVAFDDIGPGRIFGELAAIDGHPRSANVVAISATTVAFMNPPTFKAVLADNADVGLRLMCTMAQIIRTSVERIMDLSPLGAHNRVYAELLRLAGMGIREDGTARISPVPIHGDMASRVSTTRETVARVLSDLSRKGLVKRQGPELLITDYEHLRQMVEEFRGE